MRPYVACTDDDRRSFWKEAAVYPDASPPPSVAKNLKQNIPEGSEIERFASRVKGTGGLGRPRFVAIAKWRGGRVLREAKGLLPSAWEWAHNAFSPKSRFLDLAKGQFRSPDPFLDVKEGFIIRQLPRICGRSISATMPARTCEPNFSGLWASIWARFMRRTVTLKPLSLRICKRGRTIGCIRQPKTAAADVEQDYNEWKS